MKIENFILIKSKCLIATNILLLSLISCQSNISSLEDYSKYISNPSNGFFKETSISNFDINIKYLPETYWALKEKNQNIDKNINELSKKYQNFLIFQVSIKPKDNSKVVLKDFIHRNALHQKDYMEQISILNYRMSDYFSISSQNKVFKAIDAKLEDNAFDKQISFLITFIRPKEITNSESISFLMTENFFLNNTVKVDFLQKDIFSNPKIEIKQ
ncbi:hypothetical protein AD998_21295 [bacterium 336/3]|nr:hypothetical protein AD998_21295 [bacterium 336/3]